MYVGDKEVSGVYYGDNFVSGVYLGDNEIWSPTIEVFSADVTGAYYAISQTNRVIDSEYVSQAGGAYNISGYYKEDSITRIVYELTEKAIRRYKYATVTLKASAHEGYGNARVSLTNGEVLASNTGTSVETKTVKLPIENYPSISVRLWYKNDSAYSGNISYVTAGIEKIVLSRT